MNAADLLALLPLIVVAASAVVVLLGIALRRDRRTSAVLAALGLLAALACLPLAAREAPRMVTALLVVDGFALLVAGLMFAAALLTVVLVHACPIRGAARGEEFHVLVLIAALGAAVLGASRHFAALFLGVELISVALFALVPYARNDARALEAGVKYLVLAGAASALLLFGIALIYAAEGTLVFAPAGDRPATPWRLAGHALLIAGIGFKLSLVPFHLWRPLAGMRKKLGLSACSRLFC